MHESDPRVLDEALERCWTAARQLITDSLSEDELQRTLAHADEVLARLDDGPARRHLLATRNSLQHSWDERRDGRFAVPQPDDEAAGVVARALFTKGTLDERLGRAHEAMDEVERLIERTGDWVMEGRIRKELEPLMNQISKLEARLRGELP